MSDEQIAVIAFRRDEEKARELQHHLGAELLFYEENIFKRALSHYQAVVAIMAAGIVVRGIAPHLKDKWSDTPVVVVDSSLRFAIPLVGGHHGANELALRLGELGLVPVLTTATEAQGKPSVEGLAKQLQAKILNRDSTRQVNLSLLTGDVEAVYLRGSSIALIDENVTVLERRALAGKFVIGIGAHRKVDRERVIEAITSALQEAGISLEKVAFLATAELKRDEAGILEAAEHFNKPLIYVSHEVINSMKPVTASRAERLGLVGVCEPAALAVSLKRQIVLPKKSYGDVTIAIAE